MDVRPDFTGAVRYIKLGRGGAWADKALEDGTIPFGFNAVPHSLCSEQGWPEAAKRLAERRTPSGVSQGMRELKDFYGLPDGTMFVTMADGHLWWALVEGPVDPLSKIKPDGPTRFRRTRRGWSDKNLAGERLALSSLTSALTRTANYKATLCAVESVAYLLRRIRGEPEPLHEQAMVVQEQMRSLVGSMIAHLHWRDLETLVDLIFVRDGWKRFSVLGEDQPAVDLVLEHGTTRQRAWVQVKAGQGRGFSTVIEKPLNATGRAIASTSFAVGPTACFASPIGRNCRSGQALALPTPPSTPDCSPGSWSEPGKPIGGFAEQHAFRASERAGPNFKPVERQERGYAQDGRAQAWITREPAGSPMRF